MDKLRFAEVCEQIVGAERARNGIGTFGEKTLHAVLKTYFEPDPDSQEIRVGSFVADICGENGIIEIQTRQFYRLVKKLEAFLEYADVTVVYPLCPVKYVRWLDPETGELSERHKSPRRTTLHDIFSELPDIKYALDNPRFKLCVCLIEAEDIRYLNGWSKNRKRGSSRCDRVPITLIDEVWFERPEDYARLMPDGLPEEFTSKDYAEICRTGTELARSELNVLCYLGLVENTGKRGRSKLYRKTLGRIE